MKFKIIISEVSNGFTIVKYESGGEDTCGGATETFVANEASQVRDIVYKLLPKG